MGSQIETLRKTAKKNPKKIVLPEAHEDRVIEAAKICEKEGLAEIILIKESDIKNHPKLDEAVDTFYNARKHKGITPKEARETVTNDPVYFGALLVRLGLADGFVAGASHTTTDVARAALFCVGLDKKANVMSSSFIIELEGCPYGDGGLFLFADCGIVPNPDAEKLANIAISSSKLYEDILERKPRVALLSYSTKRSAKGESVDKVLKALAIVKKKAPHILIDGELQFDAAIIPEVAKIKAPKSSIAGSANVLIFPNLDAGNIAYKLIQRLGKARVVGPILQGLAKPASDLSRGCGVQEIVDAITVIGIRAERC